MGDNENRSDELGGMARSIGDLFESFDDIGDTCGASADDDAMPVIPKVSSERDAAATHAVSQAPTAAPASPARDEADEDEGEMDAPPADPRARALHEAVSRFLSVASDQRLAVAEQVSRAWEAARSGELYDALAEAADALLVQPVPDRAAEELAYALIDDVVRTHMARRLGSIRDERRRGDVIAAYTRLGDPMAEAVARALSDTQDRLARRTYVATLVALGEAGVRVVEEMVSDDRWYVVRNGVAVFGEIGGEAAIASLTGTLAHQDARVRKETLLSLARIGTEDAGMLALGMLADPDPEVRATAARAVAVMKVERALKPLLERLGEEDEDMVVERLLRALGELGDPGAVPAIEKRAVGGLLRKPPTDVRVAAYTALARIGTPRARSLVEAAADDRDEEVRAAVRTALREMA